MKKTMKTLAAVALCAVAMVAMLSSCNTTKKVPSQQEIEAKIVGKWKSIQLNGSPLLTNDRAVMTYGSDKTETFSISRFQEDIGNYLWENKMPYTWSVEGNTICEKPVSSGVTSFNKAIAIDDNHYSYIFTKILDTQGVEHIVNLNFVAQKITADYSKDIIGIWEGVAITGDETYGDANHRIEYKADGTYEYYSLVNGKWETVEDVFNEYNVDGDWLATRWQEKGSDEMLYEWWDIDYIKGDEMKWSALRAKEDGTRFTTTFTWKRVK